MVLSARGDAARTFEGDDPVSAGRGTTSSFPVRATIPPEAVSGATIASDFDVLHDKIRFRDGTVDRSEVIFPQTVDGLAVSGVQASFVIGGRTEDAVASDAFMF